MGSRIYFLFLHPPVPRYLTHFPLALGAGGTIGSPLGTPCDPATGGGAGEPSVPPFLYAYRSLLFQRGALKRCDGVVGECVVHRPVSAISEGRCRVQTPKGAIIIIVHPIIHPCGAEEARRKTPSFTLRPFRSDRTMVIALSAGGHQIETGRGYHYPP